MPSVGRGRWGFGLVWCGDSCFLSDRRRCSPAHTVRQTESGAPPLAVDNGIQNFLSLGDEIYTGNNPILRSRN
jgi:hypothetical protein